MKKFLIFIGGFVAGILVTVFVLYIISIGISSNSIQYIEIKGKKGNVTLYTGMPKDSVQMLVGKPDEVDLHSAGGTTFENWGYKMKNKYVSDLDIDFVDGKLEGVRQN